MGRGPSGDRLRQRHTEGLYHGDLLYEDTWAHSGTRALAAFDLWWREKSAVFFDDFSLVRVEDSSRALKQDALSHLNTLLAGSLTKTQRPLVSAAAKLITQSLNSSYWVDDLHLKKGVGVGGLLV